MRVQVMLSLACLLAAGCQQVDEFLNPSPTTEGSRVSEKLTQLPAPEAGKVKTVTVYKIENKTGFPHGLEITNGMTDQLITALVKTKHFKVVERAVLDDVLTEKNLQRAGETTGTVGETQMMGAELIFAGAVTEMDQKGGFGVDLGHSGLGAGLKSYTAQVGLDIRIIDAATSEVLDSIDVRREVKKTGLSGGSSWGVSAGVEISNALDLAVRETLEEAVFQLVTRFGAK
ncbi:MAG: hypothetical protein HY812_11795 [Planctomycetes bacterium]|nr:hypothetical protein [Planctomycetota bacterium]